jgi:hypothetical protein
MRLLLLITYQKQLFRLFGVFEHAYSLLIHLSLQKKGFFIIGLCLSHYFHHIFLVDLLNEA